VLCTMIVLATGKHESDNSIWSAANLECFGWHVSSDGCNALWQLKTAWDDSVL